MYILFAPHLPEERRSFSLLNINCVFSMQRHLEEVEKELEQNQQNDALINFVGRRKALKKGEFPSLCDYENFQNFRIEICIWFSLVLI